MIHMRLTEFAVGHHYIAKQANFGPPDDTPLDVRGLIQFTVLEPAGAANSIIYDSEAPMAPTAAEITFWRGFLRILNHKNGKVQLFHPNMLASAEPVTDTPKPQDRVYFQIDRCVEIPGTVIAYDVETGRVVVREDDDGQLFYGFEDQIRPNDDIEEGDHA